MSDGLLSVGYLGPCGSFTHQALNDLKLASNFTQHEFRSVREVLESVRDGEVDMGFVPFENSIEGTVNVTQDILIFDVDLYILAEAVLDIRHFVLGKKESSIETIRTLYSMPVATAQCVEFIRNFLPNAKVIETDSTSAAAERVSVSMDNTVGAIASERAAQIYGLKKLTSDISDYSDNQTRFVLVGKEQIPQRTGNDITGIVVFQRADEPGSLISILQEFAARQINLRRLSSRPTKYGGLGDYCFVIFADGHIDDELLADALQELYAKQGAVKFLGSFPAASPLSNVSSTQAAEQWREARKWVQALRSRISR